MESIRRAGGQFSAAQQQVDGTLYNTDNVVNLQLTANTNPAWAVNVALAFGDIDIPQGSTIFDARLILHHDITTSGANAFGQKYNLSLHKQPSVNALRTTDSATTVANDVNQRLSQKSTAQINVNSTTAYTADTRDVTHNVAVMVKELVDQATWDATDNNLIFLFHSPTDVGRNSWLWGPGADRAFDWCELYITYGTAFEGTRDIGLGIIGDSHAVCFGQEGYPRNNIPITFPYWDVVVQETYAGMVEENNIVTGGDLFGGGDQSRGYAPSGLAQKNLQEIFGNEVIWHRAEFAKGGTTTGQWWFWKFMQQAEEDSPPPYLYDPTYAIGGGPWSVVDAWLENPGEDIENVLLMWSMNGNDFKNIGNQAGYTRLIEPQTSYYDDVRDDLIVQTRDMWVHIFQKWEDNNINGFILPPGYQNMVVIGPDPAGYWHYPPTDGNACDDQFERMVHSSSGFGIGYANADWDGGKNELRDPGFGITSIYDPFDPWILAQSTHMQVAIWKQFENVGSFQTEGFPYAFFWSSSLAWAVHVPGFGGPEWVRTNGAPVYRTTDVWKECMRNVTDITVNKALVENSHIALQGAVDLLAEDHPEWAEKVFFQPNQLFHGPDTVYSADPDSPWAQPPKTGRLRTDGLHPSANDFDLWIRDYLDRVTPQISIMPNYRPPITSNFFFTL